jgi:hypothetical protein
MLNPVRVIAAGAFAAFLAQSAAADTISYADGMHMLIGACGKDVEKYCSKVRLGSGRIEACINDNSSKISSECTATLAQVVAGIEARAQAEGAAPQICASDAKRLCHNFREGDGRVLGCLIRRDNVHLVTKKCNAAIDNAGWR